MVGVPDLIFNLVFDATLWVVVAAVTACGPKPQAKVLTAPKGSSATNPATSKIEGIIQAIPPVAEELHPFGPDARIVDLLPGQ